MRRLLTLLLLAGVLVVVPTGPAWACSCGEPPGGPGGFVGVVRDVDKPYGATDVRVRFAVEWTAGDALGTEVELTTAAQGPACGYEFTEGRRYRVYTTSGETTSCDGNQDLGFVRPPGMDESVRLWTTAGVTLLLLAAVLVTVRVVRRGRAG